jgi:hypothetical protein
VVSVCLMRWIVGGSLNGAEGQNRTADTTIFSRMLYQLSYLGTRGMNGTRRTTEG